MVLANEIARTLLTIDRQAAVGEMIVGQTLVADDPSALENLGGGGGVEAYL